MAVYTAKTGVLSVERQSFLNIRVALTARALGALNYLRTMTNVYLRKKIAPRIANGHPWIFGNEVERVAGSVEAGDIVDVFYADGKLAGRGYINPKSQIMVRLLTRKQEEINDQFFPQQDCRSMELPPENRLY